MKTTLALFAACLLSIPTLARAGEGSAWAKAQASLSSTAQAGVALDDYLKAYPKGAHAARAWLLKARQEQDLGQARAWLDQAWRLDPQGADGCAAGLEAGRIAFAQSDTLAAEASLAEALGCGPSLQALALRGQCRLLLKKLPAASADFAACLALSPSASGPEDAASLEQARLGLADAAAAEGDSEAALASYSALWLAKPPSSLAAQALWQAAQLRQARAETATAQGLYALLVKEYPDSFEAGRAAERLPKPAAPAAAMAPPAKAGGRFTVQVGSFSQKLAAAQLYNLLKGHGYPVRKGFKTVNGHRFIDVSVGVFKSREAAAEYAKNLGKKEDLPTLVKPME
jgi:cell division septation protein DedD